MSGNENVNVDKRWLYDKLDAILVGTTEARTEIKNLHSYIQAVSANQKTTASDLAAHKENVEAHGAKAVEKSNHHFIAYGSLIISAAALLWSVFKGVGAAASMGH